MTRAGRLTRSEVAKLPTGSAPELLLSVQLEQAGIPFEREYRFSERKWRFDFAMPYAATAVEVEGGSFTGGHKRGLAYESDCDKHNSAMLRRWRVYRFTPKMVEDGRAIAMLRLALHMKESA